MSDPVRRLVQSETPQHGPNLPQSTMRCEDCRDERPATTMLFRWGCWLCDDCVTHTLAFLARMKGEAS